MHNGIHTLRDPALSTLSISIWPTFFSVSGVSGVLNPTVRFSVGTGRVRTGLRSSPTSLDGSGVSGTLGRASTRGVCVAVRVKKPSRVVCLPVDFGGAEGDFLVGFEAMPGVLMVEELALAIEFEERAMWRT